MTTPHPSPPRRWPWLRFAGLVLLALVVAGAWRKTLREQALRDVLAAGSEYWEEKPDVRALAREDWRYLFRRETWHTTRCLKMWHRQPIRNLHSTLSRLSLDQLTVGMDWQNMDGLHDLPSLKLLEIGACDYLQNMDGVRDLPSLQELSILACPYLQNMDGLRDLPQLKKLKIYEGLNLLNVDALHDLTSLQELLLYNCPNLANVDRLRELRAVERLSLRGCTGLQNIDGILELPALKEIDLSGCERLSPDSIAKLKATHLETLIFLPDGKAIFTTAPSPEGN